MKTANGDNVGSRLLRRLAGAFEVPLFFWGSGVAIGCVVFLSAALLYPLWIQVKPRPTIVAQPLLNTPLEPLAPWLAFLLLYVPDMLLLFALGLFAGSCVRRSWLRWLSACVAAYTVLSVALGGSIWQRAVVAAIQVNLLDLRYGVLCLVIVSAAYAGGLVAIRLSSPDYERGSCPKCGYCLYGLPSAVCPECGRPFSPSEAESDVSEKCEESESSLSKCSDESSRCARSGKSALRIRLSILAPLLGVYFLWDWMPLRIAQRDLVVRAVRVSGYSPTSFIFEGSPALRVEDKAHYYIRQCTYVDLLMIVAVFVWVFGATLPSNIIRIAVAGLVMFGWNLVRLWAWMCLDVLGVDRFYAHDLAYHIIWWPTVVSVVGLALRRDFRGRGVRGTHTS